MEVTSASLAVASRSIYSPLNLCSLLQNRQGWQKCYANDVNSALTVCSRKFIDVQDFYLVVPGAAWHDMAFGVEVI